MDKLNTKFWFSTMQKNAEEDYEEYLESMVRHVDVPVKAVLGLDLVCVFETEEQVRMMQPDQAMLMNIEGRLQNATAAGKDADCVSRSFGPKLAVPEDPVCGSAHCQIADYWSKELGKTMLHAYQASKRGGHLYCEMQDNGRIRISGEAALVAVSEIAAKL